MGIPTDHFVTNINSFLSMSEILKRYSLLEEMLINISYIYQNVDTMVADKTFKELPEYTKENQCQSYFIKDNFPPETSKKQTAIAIVVCFNESSNIEKDLDNNEYYLYRPRAGITKLSREDLSNRFKTSKFNKIPSYEIEIPGIKTK